MDGRINIGEFDFPLDGIFGSLALIAIPFTILIANIIFSRYRKAILRSMQKNTGVDSVQKYPVTRP
ncbi:MAG: hypothetical protein H7X71_02885, partial [Chitinophagales bacterium]|nr:hypothetical protein [Chitinophagales bacterium]